MLESGTGLRSMTTPFGATITDDDSSIRYFGSPSPKNMTYSSSNGLRVWTCDGKVHEYQGDVIARTSKEYRLCINKKEGAMMGVFDLISVVAITPASGSAESMQISLLQSLQKHPVH